MLVQHFQRIGKYHPPQEPDKELHLPKMAVRSQFTVLSVREEQKLVSKPLKLEEENAQTHNDEGESTPRLANPIEMLKRTKPVEDPDTIPSERPGIAPCIPLLNPHSIYKKKAQANRSQLVTNNRSIYGFVVNSMSSHE